MNGSFQIEPNSSVSAVEIGAVAADRNTAFAGLAVQRLDDDLAMLGVEIPDLGQDPGDHRRRHEAGEIEHEQLLGRVADRCADR